MLIGSLSGGGAQRVCVTLANGLARRYFEIDLVVLGLADAAFVELIDPRVQLKDLRTVRVRSSVLRLYAYLRSRKPDVVLVFNRELLVVVAILRAIAGLRFALVSRNINMLSHAVRSQRSFWRRLVVEPLVKLTYRSADRVVAQTHQMATDLVASYGVNAERIDVIHNPVSQELAAAGLREGERQQAQPYFLFVGKLEQQKGLPLLFDAFERVYSKCPGVNLVILGEGSLKQELKREVGVRKLEHAIHFKGFQRELVGWYRNALATVLTSHYEGMPNVLIESIALGTPVVAFDCPSGPADIIIDGKNGYLVPYPDTVAFADRLRIIAEFSPFVPSQVRATAERFREDRIVERYIEVIENVAKRDSWRVA